MIRNRAFGEKQPHITDPPPYLTMGLYNHSSFYILLQTQPDALFFFLPHLTIEPTFNVPVLFSKLQADMLVVSSKIGKDFFLCTHLPNNLLLWRRCLTIDFETWWPQNATICLHIYSSNPWSNFFPNHPPHLWVEFPQNYVAQLLFFFEEVCYCDQKLTLVKACNVCWWALNYSKFNYRNLLL